MDRWHAIKAFISIVELRSYTAAGRQLGLSRSHLSKQITILEDALGVRLLNRTTKHVSPTDIGQAYYDTCTRVVGELEAAESSLGTLRRAPRGTLKILAPKSLAILELADAVREFVARYEELEVCIFLEDELLDIVEHGFDLALRFGKQADSALIARKLCSIRFIVCATPGYLRRHGTPRHPADLAAHECFRNLAISSDSCWRFHGRSGDSAIAVRGRLSSNSTVFLRECVLRGDGIGLMPSYSVRREIKKGILRPLLTRYKSAELPLYAVYPDSRHLTAKVRLCIDFLVDWFGRKLA
jgi:DNA-binding transcriptional LysR family regulator